METSDCVFNINGGNVQVLPNATQAVQNIYTRAGGEEDMALAPYIHHLEERHNFVRRIKACPDTATLCKTALYELYCDVLADFPNPEELVKGKEFIGAVKSLLSFECGIENLRIAIRKYVLREIPQK